MPNAKKVRGYSKKDLRDVSDNPELTKSDFARTDRSRRPFLILPPRFERDEARTSPRQKSWCRCASARR
jgi:hypothetical protein